VPISAPRPGEQQPPAGPVQEPDHRVDVGQHHRRPWANASNPRPSRSGHGRRRTRCNGANASTGSSSSIRLPARSATIRRTCSGARRPEIRANSATNRAKRAAAVHEPGERVLLGRQPQIARLLTVRRAHHHVGHAPRAGQLRRLDARPHDRPGLGGLTRSATADHSPGSAGPAAARALGREGLPHADPGGFNDRHAKQPRSAVPPEASLLSGSLPTNCPVGTNRPTSTVVTMRIQCRPERGRRPRDRPGSRRTPRPGCRPAEWPTGAAWPGTAPAGSTTGNSSA
jgi:hypothetical protein